MDDSYYVIKMGKIENFLESDILRRYHCDGDKEKWDWWKAYQVYRKYLCFHPGAIVSVSAVQDSLGIVWDRFSSPFLQCYQLVYHKILQICGQRTGKPKNLANLQIVNFLDLRTFKKICLPTFGLTLIFPF